MWSTDRIGSIHTGPFACTASLILLHVPDPGMDSPGVLWETPLRCAPVKWPWETPLTLHQESFWPPPKCRESGVAKQLPAMITSYV